jgi:DNA-binding Lrp family transcriptional regulator
MALDQIDEQILTVLAADSRASYPRIGQEVGLSAPAVKRRIDRLFRSGVIRRFTVELNPTALGATTESFVEVTCTGRTTPDDITKALSSHPQVLAAYTVSGEADALVHLRCDSITELEQVLERIRRDRHIERTTSVVVLTCLLDRR